MDDMDTEYMYSTIPEKALKLENGYNDYRRMASSVLESS